MRSKSSLIVAVIMNIINEDIEKMIKLQFLSTTQFDNKNCLKNKYFILQLIFLILANIIIMSGKSQQFINNLQQQTKRLLDQLKQLEQMKSQLTSQEYDELKQSTLEELKTFQSSLNQALSDPNNSLFQSELQKTKRAIFDAFKSQFNRQQIVDKLLSEQVKGTRSKISELEKRYQLKSISEGQFVGKKRKLIVDMQQTGANLSNEEAEWLKLHHHFAEKNQQEVKEQTQKNQMKIAQKKIQQHK